MTWGDDLRNHHMDDTCGCLLVTINFNLFIVYIMVNMKVIYQHVGSALDHNCCSLSSIYFVFITKHVGSALHHNKRVRMS